MDRPRHARRRRSGPRDRRQRQHRRPPAPASRVNVTCPCSIWGTNFTPADRSTRRDATPGRGRREVQVRPVRHDLRHPLLQGGHQHRHAHRQPLDADGERLAQATFTARRQSGWQTVTFSTPGPGRCPTRPTSRPTTRPTGTSRPRRTTSTAHPRPGPNGGALLDGAPLHAAAEHRHRRPTASSPTAPRRRSRRTPSAPPTTGSTCCSRRSRRPARSPASRATAGGRTSANVTWTAPSSGGTPTSYKITPYIGTTAQTATTITGTPPDDDDDDHRPDDGHDLHASRVQAINPTGAGPVVGAVQRRHPARRRSRRRSRPRCPRTPASTVRARSAGPRPTSDGDSPITGYTVTPYVGATAQTAAQVERLGHVSTAITGLTNGTSYTFKVSATNARRHRPAVERLRRGDRRRRRSSTSRRPTTVDSQDATPVELGMKFKADANGTITGIRFYKARREHGHAHRQPVDGRRHAAGQATFTQRVGLRLADGDVLDARHLTAGTTYVASYYAPVGRYSHTAGGARRPRSDNGPLHALANATSANGVYAYGADQHVPDAARTTPPTTGSTCCSPSRRPGTVTGVDGDRGRADVGDACPGRRPPSGGAADLVQDHAVRRRDGADRR